MAENSSKELSFKEYHKKILCDAWGRFKKERALWDALLTICGITVIVGAISTELINKPRSWIGFWQSENMILAKITFFVFVFIYICIYLFYVRKQFVITHNEQQNIIKNKEKQIDDLSPAKPEIEFVFSGFSPSKGIQRLQIINHSPSAVICHAVFSYIALLIINRFPSLHPYPKEWHSKKLFWDSQMNSNGEITIDGNDGCGILDIAETTDKDFCYLFQNGENIQRGFDGLEGYFPKPGLPEGAYLITLRIDGTMDKKVFFIEKKYFVLFKIETLGYGEDIKVPIFQLQEAFE